MLNKDGLWLFPRVCQVDIAVEGSDALGMGKIRHFGRQRCQLRVRQRDVFIIQYLAPVFCISFVNAMFVGLVDRKAGRKSGELEWMQEEGALCRLPPIFEIGLVVLASNV